MIKLPPDITFVIQVVAFVVLWQLLRVILFIPMQRALKARTERTSGTRKRAETVVAEAAALAASIDQGLAAARKAGADEGDEIRRRAEAEEQAILTRYRDEASALLERERQSTEEQVKAARQPLDADAARLADSVVLRILGRAA